MIFASFDEMQAFKFICSIASDAMSNSGCNDLDDDDKKKFSSLRIQYDEGGLQKEREVLYDFDILYWLES